MNDVDKELRQTELRIASSVNDLFEIELRREHQVKNPRGSYRLIFLGLVALGYAMLTNSNQDHEH